MMLSPRPQDVRELVQRTFEDLDVAPLDWCELKETLLIDQGRYVARSYRLEGYMAMWLVSVGILQFYDEEGNMLRTINLLLETEPERLAA